jgi:septal ring factor EnvC (AmiA/AmiB activator)
MVRNRYKNITIIRIAILSLYLIGSLLWADELEDKMKQLRNIEKQIDVIQQKAKVAEQKKQKAQTDISKTLKVKTAVDQKVNLLQKKEAVAEDSLQAISQRVRSNEERIADLKKLGNDEFLRLFYIDMQDKYIVQEVKDRYLLSMLISSTVKGIRDLSDFHRLLVQTQEERRHEYVVVHSTRVQETKKSAKYQQQIKNLQQQTQKLSKEKAQYDKQVTQLKKDASELESLVARLTAATGKKVNNYKFSNKTIPWPVRGEIIREYGEESRGQNTSVQSNGIDIAVAEGTSVKAVDDGEVVFSDRYGGQGKLIIIDHKNGFFSVYAYNRDLLVSNGAKVIKGQVIAKSGKTGSATQPSLHFELRKDGRAVNPMNYLE